MNVIRGEFRLTQDTWKPHLPEVARAKTAAKQSRRASLSAPDLLTSDSLSAAIEGCSAIQGEIQSSGSKNQQKLRAEIRKY